jgi:uncharacterized membrane protein YeiH
VFAVTGALAAGRKSFDLLGVLVLAIVTAVGGGTIRDVLLDRHPLFWLADPAYLIVICCAALATVAYTRWRRPPDASLLVVDGLGLALFSIVGAQIVERTGLPPTAGILLGMVTGAAGGVVRDVLCSEIPLMFRPGALYATAAIVGTAAYFALEAVGVARGAAMLIGMAVVATVRFASVWWRLHLPVYHLADDDGARTDPKPGPES